MHKDLLTIKGLSLALGFIYALFIGLIGFTFPQNMQITIFGLTFAFVVYVLARSIGRVGRTFYLILASAAGLSLYGMVTTGPLLVPVNIFTLLFMFSMLILYIYRGGGFPQTATEYVRSLLLFIKDIAVNFFQPYNFKSYFSWTRVPKPNSKLSGNQTVGVILAIPILLVFHILFTFINVQYAQFMTDVFEWLWEVIKFIIDIDIIWIALKAIINGYILFILLVSTAKIDTKQGSKSSKVAEILSVALFLSVVLFAIFSFFQTQLLLLDYSKLPFKELSLYAQKGFWELVLISVFGYGLFLLVFNHTEVGKVGKRTVAILSVFIVELILISIYSYHKLFILQWFFGLKDQRILATVAVSLIFISFVLSFGRIWRKVSSRTIFSSQAGLLILAVLFMNVINLDLVATKTFPLRYYVDEVPHKDYSYLLGNSFDNHSEWIGLFKELKKNGLVHPKDEYYWGWYSSICSPVAYHSVDLRRFIGYDKLQSYVLDRHDYLVAKYDSGIQGKELNEIAKFNLNEYQSYMLVKKNRTQFEEFGKFLLSECQIFRTDGGDELYFY